MMAALAVRTTGRSAATANAPLVAGTTVRSAMGIVRIVVGTIAPCVTAIVCTVVGMIVRVGMGSTVRSVMEIVRIVVGTIGLSVIVIVRTAGGMIVRSVVALIARSVTETARIAGGAIVRDVTVIAPGATGIAPGATGIALHAAERIVPLLGAVAPAAADEAIAAGRIASLPKPSVCSTSFAPCAQSTMIRRSPTTSHPRISTRVRGTS